MKLLYLLPVLLVLSIGISQAYAESIFEFQSDADHPEKVTLFGIVEIENPDDVEQILLQILDSDDNMVFRDLLRPDREGEFMFWVNHNELSGFGEYEAKITYLDDAEKISFEISPFMEEMEVEDIVICVEGDKIGPNGYCIPENPTNDVPTIQDKIKDLNEAEERIRELETRVMQLENEKSVLENANEELQRQVDFLQEQLDNLSKQFTDSVETLNKWFVGQITDLQN